jgi:hypothetical protein
MDGDLPDHMYRIAADFHIRGDDGQILQQGLDDQQPVEGITVDIWQAVDLWSMAQLNREWDKGVMRHAVCDLTFLAFRKDQATFRYFCGYLPDAGGTQVDLVAPVLDERAGNR